MAAEHAATQTQGSPAARAPAAAQRCGDCGREFRPSAAGMAPRCPQCGSTRCRPLRRTVAGRSRSGAAPVEEDRFARVALWGSLITSEQFDACVAEQERRAAAGEAVPSLPQLLIDRGYLRPEHADAVFRAMTTRTPEQWRNQFGQIALRKGVVTERQLRECLEEQTRLVLSTGSGPILGHLLLERGYMTEAQVLAILRVQARRELGALHELEAAVRPTRARLGELGRRHRRLLVAAAFAAGIAVAALIGGWAQARLAAPTTYAVICDQCGYRAEVAAAALAKPCPHCGRGQMLTPLRCAACGVAFPLKVHLAPDGRHWLDPCPQCGTLTHVRLPEALEPLRANPPPQDRDGLSRK